MTLLGKAFTVVIFLLSLTFMVLALVVNASHRNWRDLVLGATGYKATIEAIDVENQQLRDAAEEAQASLAREQAARRTALAALQTQLDQLTNELELSVNTNQKLEAKNTELAQLDRSRAEELQRLTEANTILRGQIRKEQEDRDKLFAETLVLTDNLNEVRGVRQELEVRNDALQKQLTRFREIADHMGIRPEDPLDGAPPERNGNILVVDRPKSLVEVSIGYDDGLRKGHFLNVTRDGRFITRLRVRETDPNRSVAEIMRDYNEGIILEGDRVDTSID
ncbi:hypothetical protein [Stieleria varia]|uniref:Chromosome partition protein Smc n=1 Tax=Stieleria varia TaxID=2528005 RepID=A0A5C6B6T0_9BACT|nr:hypothetical protein [Stieleria varia]TWU06234.1 hypothetical protein Pla52n_19540 [Stieleria varia]